MPAEVVRWATEHRPGVIVDGTYGGGSHSRLLADQLPPGGRLIALDRDPAVIAREEIRDDSPTQDSRVELFLGSYEKAFEALRRCELNAADAFILDLGLSSDQLADRQRGFSFQHDDAELDLRFDPETDQTAMAWLAGNDEKTISDAIYRFGEERFSRRVGRRVAERNRARRPVRTVGEMVAICRDAVPRSKNHDIHPATRTFQALRIVVNDELGALTRTLAAAPGWIAPGGRVVAISFHSLEDRIVKHAFRDDERWDILTRKPLKPSDAEIAANPRARSAKMRVARRK